MLAFTAQRLTWSDEALGAVATPNGPLPLTRGLGSGLCLRAGDPPAGSGQSEIVVRI